MAYIQEKVKGKKIVSFKIKACLGRDLGGKQLFKCTTWYPPADLTPAKARKEAQKVAAIWEDEVRQAYLKEREEKAVAGVSPAYTFDTFLPHGGDNFLVLLSCQSRCFLVYGFSFWLKVRIWSVQSSH